MARVTDPIQIDRDVSHIPRNVGNHRELGPIAVSKVAMPTLDLIGSRAWNTLSTSIVLGTVSTAVYTDLAGPAAPGAMRTDQQGPSIMGEYWYIFGGYAVHDDATPRNLALGISRRNPAGTTIHVQICGLLGAATGNPLWIPRPFIIDWLSKVYASTNGALVSAGGTETGTITAGARIAFRYHYIPLQLGEYILPSL